MANGKLATDAVKVQLAKLRNDYLARLPAELSVLNELATMVAEQRFDRDTLDALHHGLHKLAGSGGTFGLSLLSTRARSLEQRVKAWLSGACADLDKHTRHSFATDISALGTSLQEVDGARIAPVRINIAQPANKGQVVWLIEDDVQLAREFVLQLESFNYVVRLFQRIDDAEIAAQTEQPDMLIMDVMFEHEKENATVALKNRPALLELKCPLIFVTSTDDFQSRVRAVQLGAQGYFLKPLDVPRLVNRMVQLFEQRHVAPQRVLIVDDDEVLSAHYRLVLIAAGMEVEVLQQTDRIIEKLSSFHPELMLMDVHMPVYSGPDLAGVIRQYDKWASLPLVYLSAEMDLDKQILALSRGADDFLTKPIPDAQLVAAVRVRIERARQLEAQISKDSLTGLLKHASIKEAIELEVMRSRRGGKPLTVAMLDIDHFKMVNDSYGHAMGDMVISSTAMLLRQRVRQSDIIGRYGGEEFIVVLPECEVEKAQLLMDDIRQRFAAVKFHHEGRDFSCTFSAGLACTNNFPDSSGAALLAAADSALYVAKHGGRNQVSVTPVGSTKGTSSHG